MANEELTNLDVIPLSGLTVNDIKNYINKLSLEAGVMSATDIRSYIDDIASGAGVQTEEELRNLIEVLAVEANVLPRNEILDAINVSVIQEIDNVNDNKDYINNIRDDIIKDVDTFRETLNLSNTEIQGTSTEVTQLESKIDFQYQKLNDSLTLIEATIKTVEASETVWESIQQERSDRIALDSTLNSKINAENLVLTEALEDKVSLSEFQNELQQNKTLVDNELESRFGEVNTTVDLIQMEIQTQISKLDVLLLDTTDFQNKLNILASTSTDSNLSTLNSLITQVTTFEETVVTNRHLLTALNTKVLTTEADSKSGIQSTRELVQGEKALRFNAETIIKNDLDSLRLSTAGDITDVRNDLNTFEEKINQNILNFGTMFTGINATIEADYLKVFDAIKVESKARENNNKVLDSKIFINNAKLYDRLSELDKSDELIQISKDFQLNNNKLIELSSNIIFNKTLSENGLQDLETKVNNNNSTIFSKFNTEESSRIQELISVNTRLDNEISTRLTETTTLTASFSELKEDILQDVVDAANFTDDEKNTLMNSIAQYEAQAQTNYNAITALQIVVQDAGVTLETGLVLANESIVDKDTLIRTDLSTETSTRVLAVQNISTSLDELQLLITGIIGTGTINIDNLGELTDRIEANRLAGIALNTSLAGTSQNDINTLDVRVYDLELNSNNNTDLITAEVAARSAQDVVLNSLIETVENNAELIDTNIQQNIFIENQGREEADANLALSIQDLNGTRLEANTVLQTNIDGVQTSADNYRTELLLAISEESTLRESINGTMLFSDTLRDPEGNYITNTTDAINTIILDYETLGDTVAAELIMKIEDGHVNLPDQLDDSDLDSLHNTIIVEASLDAATKVLQETTRALTAEETLDVKHIDISTALDTRIGTLETSDSTIQAEITSNFSTLDTAISTENTRALNAELLIQNDVNQNEVQQVSDVTSINTNIDSIRDNIDVVEADIATTKIATSTYRAGVPAIIDGKVQVETDRAVVQEGLISTALTTEVTDREQAVLLVYDQINAMLLIDTDHETRIANLRTAIDAILLDTTIDLDSLIEIVNFINANDIEIIGTITSITTGAGLELTGDYIANATNNYTAAAISIMNSVDLIDTALKMEETTRISVINTLTQNLSTEIQNRIDLGTSLTSDIGTLDSTLRALLDTKVDDTQVLTDVPTGALFTDTDTVYSHPASHDPSIITQDESNRFVTDIEKSLWNNHNLQQALENSSTLELLMATEPLTFKEGIGVSTNIVLEVVDFNGTQVFSVNGEGNVTVKAIDATLTGIDNISIDGSTDLRMVTVGAIRQTHRAGVTNTRAINLEVDANGFSDTSGVVVNYIADGLSNGDTGRALALNVDTNTSTGGVIEAMIVSKSGHGVLDVHGMHCGSGVAPIYQISGIPITIEQAFTYDNSLASFADVTAAFDTDTINVPLFEEDNDMVYIGHSLIFTELDFVLNTISSKTIDPVFEYSQGSGVWQTFTPYDGTNGMSQSGVIRNNANTMTGWATDSVNSVGSKFWIRITRTRNNIDIVPIDSKVALTIGVEFGWDELANISINNMIIEGTINNRDTTTDGIKLDTVADSANNYVHPTGDGNLHVPVNGVTNLGNVLTASAVAGTYTWEVAAGGGVGAIIGTSIAISHNDTALFSEGPTSTGRNIAFGEEALYSHNDGGDNIALGYLALRNDIGGYLNIAIGYEVMSNADGGWGNIGIGEYVLTNANGYANIAMSSYAGENITTGSYNVCIGESAGTNISTGSNNTALGAGAGDGVNAGITGSDNISAGDGSHSSLTTGLSNIAIGKRAGLSIGAGSYNVCIGEYAGRNIIDGNQNVYIGYNVGYNDPAGSNQLRIGDNADESIISGDFTKRELTFNAVVNAVAQAVTTTSVTPLNIELFDATEFTGAKLIIQASETISLKSHITELLITHDSVTALSTQYGDVFTVGALATFNVTYSGTNKIELNITAASALETTYKISVSIL